MQILVLVSGFEQFLQLSTSLILLHLSYLCKCDNPFMILHIFNINCLRVYSGGDFYREWVSILLYVVNMGKCRSSSFYIMYTQNSTLMFVFVCYCWTETVKKNQSKHENLLLLLSFYVIQWWRIKCKQTRAELGMYSPQTFHI